MGNQSKWSITLWIFLFKSIYRTPMTSQANWLRSHLLFKHVICPHALLLILIRQYFACCNSLFLCAVREDSHPLASVTKPPFNGNHQLFGEHHINLGSAKIFRVWGRVRSEASSKMKICLFNYSLPSLNVLCFVVSDYSIFLCQYVVTQY